MASFEFLGLAVHTIWFTTIASHFVMQVAQNQNHQLKTPFERCWDFLWCCGRKCESGKSFEDIFMRWAWIIELDSGPSGWIRLTSYSWMGWNPRKNTQEIGFPVFFSGKRPVGLPGKLRWIELLGLLAKLIMWWRQWGEIYSKLYGNAGEKMRRFERFDSKKMILEFLGVIIYLSNCFRVYVCSLICTCFVFLKSQEHQCRWGELEIISCSLHPVCEYVSCMWPLSSGFDASRRNPSNAQVWDVIRFSIAQREIVEKFQFHSMFFSQQNLVILFLKRT